MSGDGYVVAVKPSARRASAAAGEWVRDHGPTRAFPGRKAARSWARECSGDGALVYVRDANPGDGEADGYLMALARRDVDGATATEDPGEQAPIPAFDPENPRSDGDQAGLERYGEDLSLL